MVPGTTGRSERVQPAVADGSSAGGSPITVLHVDDDEEFAHVTAELLERTDETISVEVSTDADEAVDRVADEAIDCVVADYVMPSTDGLELLDAVRAERPDLPFIIYTGRGNEAVASEAISAGVTEYVRKDPRGDAHELLAARINSAVSHRRIEREAEELAHVAGVVRRINRALVRADSRADVYDALTSVLSESEPYVFAWIGEYDESTGRVEPVTQAGLGRGYLEDVEVTADESATGQGPTARAARTREVTALQNLREAPSFEPCREAALERGYRSVASVPVAHDGTLYCVLNLYADRPFAFDDSERDLLSDVGEDVGRTLGGLEARRELELVNRVLRHDIRNDMNIVLGWTDLLADHVDEAGADHLRRIETTSRHVVELTDVSRDLLSAVVGTSDPDLEPIDLASVVEEETTKARESYGEATFTVDRPLESGPVRGNQMLSSVVRNLLNNAVQHNDAADPHVRVTTGADDEAGVVRLRVADDGPGVPEPRREAIFGKGNRGLDSEGTGMGLYLVGELVEAFGGRVDVEDSDLGGAAFVVELLVWDG